MIYGSKCTKRESVLIEKRIVYLNISAVGINGGGKD